MSQPFTHRFRVRNAEVDPQSVVFNSRYLEYADLMVTEYFRDRSAHGMPEGLEFHIGRAEIDYLRPIRFDEEIEGRLAVTRIGNASMEMTITLFGTGTAAGEEDQRATIRLVQVHVDLASGQSQRIPDALRHAFGHAEVEAANG